MSTPIQENPSKQKGCERDRLKFVARGCLEESGWVDVVQELCRAHLRTDPSFPLGSLAEAVRPAARAAVPDHVKATVLKVVRASICPTDDS
ncbi:hypothetical protein ACKKBF_B18165 [Auxenochlorella protothecoides x Auxenochlorella symbiontica]